MELMACHECDALNSLPVLNVGESATCKRCGAVIYRRKKDCVEPLLALALAGAVLIVTANIFPFLTLETGGMIRDTTLITGISELYKQGYHGLASLVLFTCIIFPLTEICSVIYITLPLKLNRTPLYFAPVLKGIITLKPWGMMEIFMLGLLISLIKLAKMATIVPGISLYAFAALIINMTVAATILDTHQLWEIYDRGRAGENSA